VKPRLKGQRYEIRFADDAVLCFQYREGCRKGDGGLTETICKIRSDAPPGEDPAGGVWAIRGRNERSAGEEASHVSISSDSPTSAHAAEKGNSQWKVQTMKKRLRRGLTAIADWCRENRHDPVERNSSKPLTPKLRGHYQYYGTTVELQSIMQFYREVCRSGGKWLSRRTRRVWLTWERYAQSCVATHCCSMDHTFLERGRGVASEEPAAVILHGGVCEGERATVRPWLTNAGTKLATADTAKDHNLPHAGLLLLGNGNSLGVVLPLGVWLPRNGAAGSLWWSLRVVERQPKRAATLGSSSAKLIRKSWPSPSVVRFPPSTKLAFSKKLILPPPFPWSWCAASPGGFVFLASDELAAGTPKPASARP